MSLETYAANEGDILSLPHLKADRKKKEIWIDALATGIGPLDPVEFFLIAENSGHNYEAIAVSKAKPSDIHKALKFIGLNEGLPYNPASMRFWPKGERVIMSFFWKTNLSARAETLIMDKRAGKPLPETGLVFVGSRFITNNVSGSVEYAADSYSPNSIAANYNEPSTVLDVPRRALQGDMYRYQTANPKYLFATNEPLRICIEPEYKNEKKRVMDLIMTLSLSPQTEGKSLNNISFSIEGTPSANASNCSLQATLALFSRLIDEGYDPFVKIRFSEYLSIKAIKEMCNIIASIETEKGIRVEPPETGMLYYKAFLPNEEHKERTKRPSQPPELFLNISSNKTITATLINIKQIWRDDTVYPDLDIKPYAVSNYSEFVARLQSLKPDTPVILVFADERISYGQLMNFLRPEILKDFPTIYVFTEKEPIPPVKSYIKAKNN